MNQRLNAKRKKESEQRMTSEGERQRRRYQCRPIFSTAVFSFLKCRALPCLPFPSFSFLCVAVVVVVVVTIDSSTLSSNSPKRIRFDSRGIG